MLKRLISTLKRAKDQYDRLTPALKALGY